MLRHYTAENWPTTFHCRALKWEDGWHAESLEFHEISDGYPTVDGAKEDLAEHLRMMYECACDYVPIGLGGFWRRGASWWRWLLWYLWPRHLKWVIRA